MRGQKVELINLFVFQGLSVIKGRIKSRHYLVTRYFILLFATCFGLSTQISVASASACSNTNGEIASMNFIWPLEIDSRATLGRTYANYVWSKKNNTYSFHSGIDIAVPIGTKVLAAASGEVVLIQENDTSCSSGTGCQDHGYGTTLILKHVVGGKEIFTQYSHLSSVDPDLLNACGPPDRFRRICLVSVWVDVGETIASSGASSSGQNDAPEHLHFEVKDNGWLAATGNDKGPFAYSLEHPDSYCYHDPLLAIHDIDIPTSPMLVSVTDAGVRGRVGPGGAGTTEYRTTQNLEIADNPFKVIATAGPTTVPQCGGWYYLRRVDWYGSCEGQASCFSDPVQGLGAKTSGVWSCKDYLTPAAASLTVDLRLTTTSGSSPLSITATGTVFGTEQGSINYTFWWDCDVDSTSVNDVMAQCGYIPTPSAGGCAESLAGVKCNALTSTTHAESHSYSSASAGTRTVKIVAERGDAPPVEARQVINVACAELTAPMLIFPVDGASEIPLAPQLQWESAAGAHGYDVNICRDSNCTDLVNSIRVSTEQWNVSPPLENLTTYYWRVSAFDGCGNGPWSDGNGFNSTGSPTGREVDLAISLLGPSGVFTTASTGSPNFALACSPSDLSAPPGGGDGTTCTATSIDGFTGQVTLSDQSLPPGLSATSTNWSLSLPAGGSQNTSIGVNVAPGMLAGTYPFEILAASGAIIHTSPLSILVQDGPDFSIECTPNILAATTGQAVNTTCTVSSLRGFSGAVDLSNSGTTSGLLSLFDVQSLNVPAYGMASGSLTLTVGANVPLGGYEILIHGASNALSHSAVVNLSIAAAPNFSITCDPPLLSTLPGGAADIVCTLTPRGGFSSSVDLTCQGAPSWVNCGFSPNPVSLAAGAGGSTLTVTTSPFTPTGYTYLFTVKGNSDELTSSFTSSINVMAAPDFELSCSPASLSAVPNESAYSTCTVQSVNGFNGEVSLFCSALSGNLSCNFTPPTLTISAGDSTASQLGIQVGSVVSPGGRELTVSGASSTLTHSTALNLSVLGSDALWWRSYLLDTSDYELAAIVSTTDGGAAMAGRKLINNRTGSEGYLMRLDPRGNVLWQKLYSGPRDFVRIDGLALSGAGFVMTGATKNEEFGCSDVDLWVAEVDSAGIPIWQENMSVCGLSSFGWSVITTSDGGYLIVGDSPNIGAGGIDAWVLKLNPLGSIEWQRAYGGSANDRPLGVRQTRDGGYIVAGHTASFGNGNSDAWIFKLAATGDIQWQNAYGGIGTDVAYGVEELSDGTYLVACWTRGSFSPSGRWVLRLDAMGNVIWQKLLRNSNGYGIDASRSRFGSTHGAGEGIVVAGDSSVFGTGPQVWITEVDASGDIVWQRLYQQGFAFGIMRTTAGGLIVGAQQKPPFSPYGPAAKVLSLETSGYIFSCPDILDTAVVVSDTDVTPTKTSGQITVTSLVPAATTVVATETVASAVVETCNSNNPRFVVSCTPTTLPSALGHTISSSCTVASVDDFNSAVTLTCGGLPATINCSFEPETVTPGSGSSSISSLSINVPSSTAPGSYPFEIVGTSGFQEERTSATVVILSPHISSVVPDKGSSSGGTAITVYGVNFFSGMSLMLGSSLVDSPIVMSPSMVTAVTPAHSSGVVGVEVVNPDGQRAELSGGFTYFDSMIFSDGFESGNLSRWSSSVP